MIQRTYIVTLTRRYDSRIATERITFYTADGAQGYARTMRMFPQRQHTDTVTGEKWRAEDVQVTEL